MLEALVTGSTGFIGSHLVESLLARNINVRCLLRKGRSNEKYLKTLDVKRFYVEDYAPEDLEESRALEEVDYVFHTAGVTKGIFLDDFKQGNLRPTQALLRAIENNKIQLKRFIYLSSTAVAGPSKSFYDWQEDTEFVNYIEHYGASKYLGEFAIRNSGLPFTIIRPGGVYGARDVDYFNLFKSIHKRINPFFGNKGKHHAIIHVDDLVNGIMDAAFSENTEGKNYYLCNDESVSWGNLQSKIIKAVDKKVFTIRFPSFFMNVAAFFGELYSKLSGKPSLLNRQKLKLSKPDFWVFSNQKAKDDFGFNPSIALEEGIKKTYEWYIKNGWLK